VSVISFVLFSVGLGGAVTLVGYFGFTDVAGAFAAGVWGIAAVCVFHLVPLMTDTIAWRRLLPSAHRKPIGELLWMRWVSESVNNLLPAAQVGGDLLRARLAAQRGVPGPIAAASIVGDITTSVLSLIAFGALGALLLFPRYGRQSALLLLGLAVSAAVIAAFYIAQRAGIFSKLAHRAARFVAGERWDSLIGSAAALDGAMNEMYSRRRDVLVSGLLAFAAWVLGAGEVWLALYFLGVPVGIVEALIFESLIQALRNVAFPVPGALGIQEGGFVLLGAALGVSGDSALALALVRRAREVIFGLPGLIVWQIAEGRHVVRTRALKDSAAGKRSL
jgi:putative membrane protein